MFNKTTLQNGLRVITYPMQNTQAVTLLVLMGAGSKYETKEINGISHLLEHLVFRGTLARPTTTDIAQELDRVGGIYNAFTGKEYMGYWVKSDAKHLDLSFDILSDILLNSLFREEDIEKEKQAIYEEINMILDIPQARITDLFENLLYGDQPAGWDIIGTKEILQKIKRNDIVNYKENQFGIKNTTVILAGNFQEKEAIEKINSFFVFPDVKTIEKKSVIEQQKEPQILLHQKETDQSHIALGVRTYDIFSEDKYPAAILANLLGGNMSSRLFQEIREKRGMAYYVRTVSENLTDSGYIVTNAGIDNKRVEEAIQIIIKEYKRLTEEKVSEEDLKKAKDNIKGHLMLSLETSDAWANYLGIQELLEEKISTPEEECAMIDKVNREDVLRVAKEIFKPEKLNLALIGPFKDKNIFKELLKI